MFKPGEVAGVRGQEERRVKVILGLDRGISTDGGIFKEEELFVAHPTVLATASGHDQTREAWRERIDAMASTGPTLPLKLLNEIERVLARMSLDWNGHWKNGEALDPVFKSERSKELLLSPRALSKEDAEALLQAVKAGKRLDHWVPVDAAGLRLSLSNCHYCGENNFGLETNGQVLRIEGASCEFSKGMPPSEFELNVPSGKLVVANDLRELFPLLEDDFNVNTLWGCRQTTLAYAAIGMAHAIVGNSCPGVFQCEDGTFKIANPPPDEHWNGKAWVEVRPKPLFDGKKVASITTDLWWYSLCDYDDFKRRCRYFKHKVKDFHIKVVKVVPGVYRFQHDDEARGHRGRDECVFARFKRVRKADKVKDFLASYKEAEVNPHAYVLAQVKQWPTLYGKVKEGSSGKETPIPWGKMTPRDQLLSWQRVADQVFCTIGSGTEWHEKGFPLAKVDQGVPDIDPPSFREQFHWYPFSAPYGGLYEPKVLTPSFAKLAFRVLESIISFGMTVNDGAHSREVIYTRQRMLAAVKRYRQLAKEHPTEADPEYVTWLNEKGRAEAWVENFDLGPEVTEKHKKHAESQRWVPEDAYAIEFDARKLPDGHHFAWHPKIMGCWARKADAQRYAILQWQDNGQSSAKHNCFWSCNASSTSVPLYTVARVKKVGEVSHVGETLVEIVYDYGTAWMKGTSRKALAEFKEKAGLRVLSKKEYEERLPEAVRFYENAEALIEAQVKARNEARV